MYSSRYRMENDCVIWPTPGSAATASLRSNASIPSIDLVNDRATLAGSAPFATLTPMREGATSTGLLARACDAAT